MNSSQLQICFMLLLGDRLYSEQEIADRLPLLKVARDDILFDTANPDGAVSIRYDDEELLGANFYTVINLLLIAPYNLLEDKAQDTDIYKQAARLRLQPRGPSLLYELQSHSPSPERNIRQELPLASFVEQWLLMSLRYRKLLDYLKDEDGWWFERYLTDPERFTPRIRELVGEEQVRTIAEADPADVLRMGGCSYGYRYNAETEEFVPVNERLTSYGATLKHYITRRCTSTAVIENVLEQYYHFEGSELLEFTFEQSQATLDVRVIYSKDAPRAETDTPKVVGLRFYEVHAFHCSNVVHERETDRPDELEWEMNKISTMRLEQKRPLVERHEHVPHPSHQLTILWEDERRIDILFRGLTVTDSDG